MAAANFERALKLVLVHEGGFVNHPRDPGGATNLGITIGTALRLGIDVDGDGDTDIVDIRLLRRSDAAKVYRVEYWDKVRADQLPPGVDYAVFDFAVNSGPKRGAIALQRAIGVADDGVIGSVTLANVAGRPADQIIERIIADRMTFLRRLKTWPDFGKGWTSRVNGVHREALAMATAAPVPTPSVETRPLSEPTPPVFQPAPRNPGAVSMPPLASPTSPARSGIGNRIATWLTGLWQG